jgi:transposase InsO family protein
MQIAPSGYWRHAARQRNPVLRSKRAKRDDALLPQIEQVWQINLQVYGADKVWKQLNRQGVTVARCTVERLMKQRGVDFHPELTQGLHLKLTHRIGAHFS